MSLCQGCKLKHRNYMCECILDNNVLFKNELNECPCNSCLIKGLCNHSCQGFVNFLFRPLSEEAQEEISNTLSLIFSQTTPTNLQTLSRERILFMCQAVLTNYYYRTDEFRACYSKTHYIR